MQKFGDYTVYYSVFNSNFLTADVASTYGITRGDNIALVNISLIRDTGSGASLGLSAKVTGRVQNLLAQSRELQFQEIDEGQATYYIAPMRIEDGDPQHFFIEVAAEGRTSPFSVRFTRTLYRD